MHLQPLLPRILGLYGLQALRQQGLSRAVCCGGALQQLAHSRTNYSSSSESNALVLAKNLLVDTLGLSRKLEQGGLTRAQAERLTLTITELIVNNKEELSGRLVSKHAVEKLALEQEAKITNFKSELQKAQDLHLATVLKDVERLQNGLDKMKAEVRHEIDKMSASQRLDLNLEKGRMRDDLQQLRDKSIELEVKLDRDVNELKASLERSKNDVIKSVIAIMGTFSAIAFTVSRLLSMQ